MESHTPSDNISMFPNRRTIDAFASNLRHPPENEIPEVSNINAIINRIIEHPQSTPAHYAAALPSIIQALEMTDKESIDNSEHANIRYALRVIMSEPHPSFVHLREEARELYAHYFGTS